MDSHTTNGLKDNIIFILRILLTIIFLAPFCLISRSLLEKDSVLLSYVILQVGFLISSSILLRAIYLKFPSFFLQFKYSRNPDLDFAILLSSSVALLFLLFKESYVIGFIFIILFTFGFVLTEIRKHLIISLILTMTSIILFYYALQQGRILLYLISTFLVIFTPFGLNESIGRNLDKIPSPRFTSRQSFPFFSNSVLIIFISFTLFSYYFLNNRILITIGEYGSIFFGIISLQLIIESFSIWRRIKISQDEQ